MKNRGIKYLYFCLSYGSPKSGGREGWFNFQIYQKIVMAPLHYGPALKRVGFHGASTNWSNRWASVDGRV